MARVGDREILTVVGTLGHRPNPLAASGPPAPTFRLRPTARPAR